MWSGAGGEYEATVHCVTVCGGSWATSTETRSHDSVTGNRTRATSSWAAERSIPASSGVPPFS